MAPLQGQHGLVHVYDAEEWVQTSLCQKLPADFKRSLLLFNDVWLGFKKRKIASWGQIRNANEIPVYSDMPSNYTVDDEAKSLAIKKTLG